MCVSSVICWGRESCADGQQELKALFTNVFPSCKVTSTKVLKDEQGISRGVGFVR